MFYGSPASAVKEARFGGVSGRMPARTPNLGNHHGNSRRACSLVCSGFEFWVSQYDLNANGANRRISRNVYCICTICLICGICVKRVLVPEKAMHRRAILFAWQRSSAILSPGGEAIGLILNFRIQWMVDEHGRFLSSPQPGVAGLDCHNIYMVCYCPGGGHGFLLKEVNRKLVNGMLGFAAGVMIAASYWSLLAPAIAMTEETSKLPSWFPAVMGFLAGGLFLRLIDFFLPSSSPGTADR